MSVLVVPVLQSFSCGVSIHGSASFEFGGPWRVGCPRLRCGSCWENSRGPRRKGNKGMKGESALRSSVKSAILFTKRYRNHQKISDIRTVGKIQLFFCRSARPGLWRSAWPRRFCTICILCSRFCSKFCSSSKLIGITSAVLEIPKLPKITVPYPVGETRKKIEGNPRKEQGHHHIDIICGIRVYDLLGSSYSSRIEELDRIKSN